MILGEQGNEWALSVDMWHCPFKLESDPIIVHRLVDVHQSVENVKSQKRRGVRRVQSTDLLCRISWGDQGAMLMSTRKQKHTFEHLFNKMKRLISSLPCWNSSVEHKQPTNSFLKGKVHIARCSYVVIMVCFELTSVVHYLIGSPIDPMGW